MGIMGKFRRQADVLLRVQLVSPDSAFADRLQAALAVSGRFDFEAVNIPIVALETADITHEHIALLVVEIDPTDPGDLRALEAVITGNTGLRVIVIADEIMGDAARTLLRLQVADWFSKTASDSDLLQACERAVAPATGVRPTSEAAVYTFLSAAGGVGNTALAVQSAFLIGLRESLSSTCLVDLDLQSGSVADYLDLTPNLQFEEIMPNPERLDDQLFEVMLSRHDSGLSVIAAPNSLRDFGDISDEVMARLLDLASLRFQNIIIDMSRVWMPWTEGVLRGSDTVYVVTEMTVPGLRRAHRLVEALKQKCGGDIRATVIVNRFRPRLISGGINSLRRKDAEGLLGDSLAGFVSEDYRLVREAIDRGVPLSEIRPRNRIDKDLADILFASKG